MSIGNNLLSRMDGDIPQKQRKTVSKILTSLFLTKKISTHNSNFATIRCFIRISQDGSRCTYVSEIREKQLDSIIYFQ